MHPVFSDSRKGKDKEAQDRRTLTSAGARGNAPWYNIPTRRITSVEHPCIINNIENGIKTIGLRNNLEKLVSPGVPELALHLRPSDPFCRPIFAKPTQTNDVLLKITVPKRTGRKRKRGSSEPFRGEYDVDGQEGGKLLSRQKNPGSILRTLQDNPESYSVEAVGAVGQSYRFRALADFQESTERSRFMNKIKDSIVGMDYSKIKDFRLDPSKGVQTNAEIIGPPAWTRMPVPFNYSYLQNPAVKITQTPAGPALTNTQLAQKVLTDLLPYSAPTIPTAPPDGIPPLATLHPRLQATIHHIRELLAARPIWTRRALTNQLAPTPPQLLKHAFQYGGYMFRSGAWREALVRYGYDPRKDKSSRVYQTLSFQIVLGNVGPLAAAAATPSTATLPAASQDPEHQATKETTTTTNTNTAVAEDDADNDNDNDDDEDDDAALNRPWEDERVRYNRTRRGKTRDRESHIFDGYRLALDGKVWQVCDITDPLLAQILATQSLRDECQPSTDGWYHSGTIAKVKGIMKAKLQALQAGRRLPRGVPRAGAAAGVEASSSTSSATRGGGGGGGTAVDGNADDHREFESLLAIPDDSDNRASSRAARSALGTGSGSGSGSGSGATVTDAFSTSAAGAAMPEAAMPSAGLRFEPVDADDEDHERDDSGGRGLGDVGGAVVVGDESESESGSEVDEDMMEEEEEPPIDDDEDVIEDISDDDDEDVDDDDNV
ncbi:MAG: hypothetical protein M1825_005840 [Sarcosagium campestre]|nr:MAG: hypothetical protein M1825_005840 [Sarcosagium campestre]